MNEQSVARVNPYRYFLCITLIILFLIGSVLSLPLHADDTNTQNAAIAAGVAAGTDVSVIIKDAVAAGMTPEQAVEAIVKAGEDPGRVVYEAITAKYDADAVIKGASVAVSQEFGSGTNASPDAESKAVSAIISAGVQAGVSDSTVQAAVASTGVPPTVIANANTQASGGSPGPAEGYSAPAPPAPPTSNIGGGTGGGGGGGGSTGGGGTIGGSGIGSSKPASPYKP